MKKIEVSTGIYWVEEPEADLYVLCGCPADSVKHMMKRGLILKQEKNGVTFETGPNAILLSDVSLQNERFSNLAEFPVLQMLYRQGMIIPNHPNNDGTKPMLIGSEDQVRAQSEYILRGNYGLTSKEEIMEAGVPEDKAEQMMRLKLRFAFNRIMPTEELLDLRFITSESSELKKGVYIRKLGTNVYEFEYKGQVVSVNLNLDPHNFYESPYQLGHHDITREYFSVIYSGEGDGWDVNRPCMSSIITFQGKIYLIDAGPNLVHTLTALGISPNEIEGIFHTHCHDDHFNGLTVLLRTDRRIKHFSTPLVRKSIIKKLSALMSVSEDVFYKYFDVRDLECETWNNIDGLEVKPIISPHPVETTIMFFRTLWHSGYKTYAHLADTSSFKVLQGMITDDPKANGISKEYFEAVKKMYLEKVDIKKIDVGGGMIHGSALDFENDESDKIILSHVDRSLTDHEKEIGSSASFGMTDVMIASDQDFRKSIAFQNLRTHFPTASHHDLTMLLNCPVISFNPGSFLVKKDEINKNLYFIISGILEFISSEHGVNNKLSAGSIVGEISGVMCTPSRGAYRAASFVKAIEIPANLYIEFAHRNGIMDSVKENIKIRRLLQNTWLFGEMISCPLKSSIARKMKEVIYKADETLPVADGDLILVVSGEVQVYNGDRVVDILNAGGFCGEENIIYTVENIFSARATKETETYHIPAEMLDDIPIVQWKLLEVFEKRLKFLGACAISHGKPES